VLHNRQSHPKILMLSARILSFIAILVSTTISRAEEWPQWRGPDRDGISKEKGLLQEWPAEGPTLVWKVDKLGDGYSSPAVADDRIFLINNDTLEDEYVQALSIKDGSQLWRRTLGKVGKPDQRPSYPGARSTPTVDGDLVFALGSDGDLVCVEAATGDEKWRKNLLKDFDGKSGTWAYAESPLVDGDVLIVTPGGKEATIVALNKSTGEVIWKSPSEMPDGESAGYASAIVLNEAGHKQYVQFCGKGLVGVEAKTGKTLWRYDHTASGAAATIASPVAAGGYVYSGTNYTGGGTVKLTQDGDGIKAEEVYYNKKDLPTAIGGAVVIGDNLFGTNKELTLCIDFKTGEVKWSQPRFVSPASILFADGRLYLHGQEKGDLALIEATPEGFKEHGHFTPPDVPEGRVGKAWEYPVISDGKLYIHDWGTLWCYNVKAEAGGRAAAGTGSSSSASGN
jgi:outer membrane protein assembly factor BamB